MNNTHFQYCQKIVLFNKDKTKILLAKRKGEADYDGVYSFIGGKMETTGKSIIDGIRREKDEEIGTKVTIKIFPNETYNLLFRKKDGNSMILPHIPAQYICGKIDLNEEYSDYKWVALSDLATFEPKIQNIPACAEWALQKLSNPTSYAIEI